jgi:hypothetical protein
MALTESPKSSEQKKADKPDTDTSGPAPVAAPGATDPVVQQLLAEQQTAVSNGDDDAIRDINKKLNELGYK